MCKTQENHYIHQPTPLKTSNFILFSEICKIIEMFVQFVCASKHRTVHCAVHNERSYSLVASILGSQRRSGRDEGRGTPRRSHSTTGVARNVGRQMEVCWERIHGNVKINGPRKWFSIFSENIFLDFFLDIIYFAFNLYACLIG